MMRHLPVVLILLTLLLSACGGGGGVKPDARRPAPVAPGDDAPRSKYGNPESYEVYGKTYHVLATARGYRESGRASWYGEEFHGKRTSSGEPYNMHAMTAAHRTLPLPSYVRVSNLQNRREVIVRVNDRGPFHDDRIIDLSFAAASELGLLRNGTAKVEVVAVDPVTAAADPEPRITSRSVATAPPPITAHPVTPAATSPPSPQPEDAGDALAPDEIPVSARRGDLLPGDSRPIIRELPSDDTLPPATIDPLPAAVASTHKPGVPDGPYLQAGAFTLAKNAHALMDRLNRAGFDNVDIYRVAGMLKVRLGPYPNEVAMLRDRERLGDLGIRAYEVEE